MPEMFRNGFERGKRVLIFLLIALLISGLGYGYYRQEAAEIKHENFQMLSTIGNLKAAQIEQWRKERLGDVCRSAKSPFVRRMLRDWLANPEKPELKELWTERLASDKKLRGYTNVFVTSLDGRVLLSAEDVTDPLSSSTRIAIDHAIQAKKNFLSDFFRSPRGEILIDAVDTIEDEAGKPVAVLIMRSDATINLFPVIQKWPTNSRTAETVLVERAGNDAVFLSNLRDLKNIVLKLRVPLTRVERPAVQAALGKSGLCEGVDYKGRQVLCDLCPIQYSNWVMIAKIDKAEILAEARYRAVVIGFIAFVLIVLAAVALAFSYRRRQADLYRAKYQSELEARKAQDQFRITLYSIGDAVITTGHDGLIQRMNPVAERMTQWREAEAQGRPAADVLRIVNEETGDEIESPVARVLRDGRIVAGAGTSVLIARDGTRTAIAESGSPIRDDAGNITGVVLIFRDQGIERAARRAIQESQDELKTVFDNLPLGIAVISTAEPGRFEYMNDHFAEFYRTTRDKLTTLDAFWEVFEDEALREKLKARMVADCETGDRERIQWDDIPITRSGRETHYVMARNIPLPEMNLLVATVWDVTEARRSEEALRRSEQEFRAVFETAAVGIGQVNPETRRWFRVNQKLCEITGYSEEEMILLKIAEITHPEDRAADTEALTRVIENDAPSYSIEKRYVRKDGSIAWVNVNASVIRDANGRATSTVGVIEDINARKRAEADLRASEARYRTLFDKAIEGIAISDPETGVILDCNEAFLRLTGYAKQELIGRPKSVLRLAEAGRTEQAAAMEGEGRVSEERLRTKSGPLREVTITAHIIDIAGQRVLQEWFRDVTEERRGQREREATLELLRLLNDRSQLHELIRMVLEMMQNWAGCEAAGIRLRDGEDFPFFESNGFAPEFIEAENLLCRVDANGRPVRDDTGNLVLECMCGRLLSGRIDPGFPCTTQAGSLWTNDAPGFVAGMSEADRLTLTRQRCTRSGYKSIALIPLRYGNKTIGLIQLNDRATGRFTVELVGFMEQLASQLAVAIAQRQAEDALRDSEEKFRRLIEGLQNEYFLYQEDRNGVYTYVSPSVTNVLGWAPEECMVHFSDSLTDSILNKVAIRHSELSLAGVPQPPFEAAVKHKDGTVRHLEVYEVPLFDPAGNVTSVEGIARNITERKRAEEERDKLEAQLRQAQKMESVGRLAGGVAHDFNNMLNVIVGYSEIALDKLGSDDPMHGYFKEILSAAERSAGLTRQLLAFARKQTISPKILDLNSIIEGMLNMLGRLIGEDTRLEWQPAASLWQVLMDPAQIDQILANLAVNARDAIAGVGRITIRTSNVEISESYSSTHDGALPGHYVLVEVSDTGCGMDADVLAHLFEPFFTTKGKGQGTGLGLATVYGIVKQNNGFIEVRSAPGRGATFEIYLPRHAAHPAAEEEAQLPEGSPRGWETVLVVEDEAALLKLATCLLESLGYTVLSSMSPRGAIEMLKAYDGKIDLLLSDIIMPEMSGRDLQERVLAMRPEIKCLFMSGYTAEVIAHRGVLDKGVHFLQKPFTLEQLAAKMREVLE